MHIIGITIILIDTNNARHSAHDFGSNLLPDKLYDHLCEKSN